MSDLIFHDPSGQRAKWVRLASGLMIALALLLGAGFFATLALAPRLPKLTLKDPRVLQALHVETAHQLKGHKHWTAIPHPRRVATGGAARPLAVGFYVSWDESSRQSLADHVDQLDVVSPQWVALTPKGTLDVTKDAQARAIIAGAKHPPSLLPGVHNAQDGVWYGAVADRMLTNKAARKAMIAQLVTLAQKSGYAGYVFDLEDLSKAGQEAYPGFIAEARTALHAIGREAWVTAPFGDPAWPLKRVQASADALMLMAYDEHYGLGDPGPAAGQDWFEKELAARMAVLDPAKTVIALGAYGYDWMLPEKGKKGSATAVTFGEATQIANDSSAKPVMDAASLNPMFRYEDENGRKHDVWFMDAVTVHNQIHVADNFRPMGYALWRMGGEDPLDWKLMRHDYGTVKPDGLEVLTPGQNVSFDGTGEILRVEETPRTGHRTLNVDKASGLITDETYDSVPTSYVVQRYGAHPGWVAITFDDGPDPRFTGKILDILKAKHAPATFFVIGKNMAGHPELVAREVREGHDVGNHSWTHPDIAAIPAAQTQIELAATQRLFETVTGRSMRLFRPPFFGDAEPSTPREVSRVEAAQLQGYLTIGLRIDPDDWKKPDPSRIISTTLERLQDTVRPGQIVLLHDSGGDRSRTVEALPGLIDALRAHGYKLVTVHELAGMTPADAMPAAPRGSFELGLDRIGFGFMHGAESVLSTLFLTAIALGVGRLLLLGVLALAHRYRFDRRIPPHLDPETGPLISVLIPCFNEAKVIESAIRGILASKWKNLEVLVLDDGSSDGTSDVVSRAFADEPRVALMTFENAGKARALNRGLTRATGDVVVALDADTQFPPETLPRLVRWFADPRVGAVAGNALVGNRGNLITRWQALEYVTAQNLERRALAALGAVTVVPGAVGAWRRSALTELGGYPADTLAEDQDLTLAVQRAGWRVEFDPQARAYTEAPDTVSGLLKQRFRWSFGTLQCLWKHRGALGDARRPSLGFIALPQIWLFQILLTAIAPLVDLAILWAIVWTGYGFYLHRLGDWTPDDLIRSLEYWAAFILLDLSAGAVGMALERRAPWADLAWMPIQRFGYRQLMYGVVIRSIGAALHGVRVGWGKLERKATVAMEAPAERVG
jgi:cellulose synthase/poly-beta-1,6-N-acetylglucosamine synthase-like glycosyltransferase/spore germination protein YaaH/peptidoglycan/xylan/chitin deacetylase (PgdA/CDA1 family)